MSDIRENFLNSPLRIQRNYRLNFLYNCLYLPMTSLESMAKHIFANEKALSFVSSYQDDIITPFSMFFGANIITACFSKMSIARSAAISFGGCAFFEGLQYLGVYGTYDPKDFLAYATGTALAIGVQELTFKKANLEGIISK